MKTFAGIALMIILSISAGVLINIQMHRAKCINIGGVPVIAAYGAVYCFKTESLHDNR